MQNLNKILAESNACGYTYQLLMGNRILMLKASGMTIGILGVPMSNGKYDISIHSKDIPNIMYENVDLGTLLSVLDEPLQSLY